VDSPGRREREGIPPYHRQWPTGGYPVLLAMVNDSFRLPVHFGAVTETKRRKRFGINAEKETAERDPANEAALLLFGCSAFTVLGA